MKANQTFRRPGLGALIAAALVWLPTSGALAETVVVTFTGRVFGATGDLVPELAAGDSIDGVLVLDDSVAGVFTPSPNPAFVRSEMLYTGAVQTMSLSIVGNPVTGSGGDVELFDAAGALAGDDSYEVMGALSAGTIGAAVPQSFFFNPAYQETEFTLSSGDPLVGPPPRDPSSFNQFLLTSAGGGTGSGQILSFTVTPAEPVPALPPMAAVGLAVSLAGCTGLALRRRLT